MLATHRQAPVVGQTLPVSRPLARQALSTTSRHQPTQPPPLSSRQPTSEKLYAQEQQQQQQQPAAPPPAKKAEGKGKLTDQWTPPPTRIMRAEGDYLERGDLLGEGGFARVYRVMDSERNKMAVKVICKEQLKSTKNRSKLFGEIKIHQAMQHPNIVCFEHCFEDDANVYMQLELCSNGSLLDLLRRRRRYTEPEARFYLVQLIGACEYMHSNSVIHRDLKLGNLMLDRNMNLRVGDFGLAALVKFPGERKKTICGTPNYIAPEILFDQNNGHSFEVDIWSIGVILYTLLIGKPPFQTKEVKNIYRRIKDNSYEFPSNVELSVEAVDLISSILTTEPDKRPTLSQILAHNFFTTGPFPSSIPVDALATIPNYNTISIRASLRNFNKVKEQCGVANLEQPIPVVVPTPLNPVQETEEAEVDEIEMEIDVEAEKNGNKVGKRRIEAKVATTAETKGMEKEVRAALQPESPIADLLRSARKPLMVSPEDGAQARRQYKDRVSQLAGTERPTRPVSTAPSKENEAPSSDPAKVRQHRRQVVDPATTSALSPKRQPLGATQPKRQSSQPPVKPVTVELVPSKPVEKVKSKKTQLQARPLYEAMWQSLDHALNVNTLEALEGLSAFAPEDTSSPTVFITSWVDYTQKYGTAYSLTDGTAGLYFNDSTTMVLSPNKQHFDYIAARKDNVHARRYHTLNDYPKELERKVYLLTYFEDYMARTLTRDVDWLFTDSERTKNMDFLVKYYRMKNAIVFKLSNNVLQFNFFDHTKVLLSQNGQLVSFIDTSFELRTFTLHQLFREAAKAGFYSAAPNDELDPKRKARLERSQFLISKLEYCRDVIKTLATRKSTTTAATAAASS